MERKLDTEHDLAQISLKALDTEGNLLAASKPVTTITSLPSPLRPLDGSGLSGVLCIIHLDVSGEACGIPDCGYYYAWTGSELALLPVSINLGGAGMDVSYAETLIFPDGGAPSDTILKVVEATAYYNEREDDDRIKGREYTTQIYLWDGKRAVPQPTAPDLLNWFQRYLDRWHYGKSK